jgi:hypothetical protein
MFEMDTTAAFGYAGVIANLMWPTFRTREFFLLGAASGAAVMGVAGLQAFLALANLQTNPLKQRTLLIVVIGTWFAHNYITHSIPGLISNALAFMISVRMLYVVQKEAQQPLK